MKLTFLGTGTSFGVPVLGCRCRVCTSDDPRDRRTRHGLLLEDGDRRLLVDTPPELRLQLLQAEVASVDAVFLSHEHADHTHGIDDLRAFTMRSADPLPLCVAEEYESVVTTRFAYIWGEGAMAQPGSSIPRLEISTFRDREPIDPAGFSLLPFRLEHGVYSSYGFRVGDLAVLIDAKRAPEDAATLFDGVRTLVVNALWFGNPHPGHFSIEEAVALAQRLGVERTYLTHLTHRVGHAELERRLPAGVEASFDGLRIEV